MGSENHRQLGEAGPLIHQNFALSLSLWLAKCFSSPSLLLSFFPPTSRLLLPSFLPFFSLLWLHGWARGSSRVQFISWASKEGASLLGRRTHFLLPFPLAPKLLPVLLASSSSSVFFARSQIRRRKMARLITAPKVSSCLRRKSLHKREKRKRQLLRHIVSGSGRARGGAKEVWGKIFFRLLARLGSTRRLTRERKGEKGRPKKWENARGRQQLKAGKLRSTFFLVPPSKRSSSSSSSPVSSGVHLPKVSRTSLLNISCRSSFLLGCLHSSFACQLSRASCCSCPEEGKER